MSSAVKDKPTVDQQTDSEIEEALIKQYINGEISQREFMAADPFNKYIQAYSEKHAAHRYDRVAHLNSFIRAWRRLRR